MNTDDERSIQAGALPGTLPMQMRGPADMAEMLPYLLGFFPDDSIVAVGLQGPSLQQGGVVRVDIPADRAQWPQVAQDTADLLVDLSEKRDRRPRQVLLYLVRDSPDPACGPPGGPPWRSASDRAARAPLPGDPLPGDALPGDMLPVVELRPLADALAAAFERADVGVRESLCVSGGRWWSFLCRRPGCCDPAGTPVRPAHMPSPIAAAATFAGLAPRGSRKAIVAGLAPVGPPDADIQRQEIERAGPGFLRELADGRLRTVDRTGTLLGEALAAFRGGARGLDPRLTARLLLGLQDKLGRDRGAEFAEPDDLAHAQRLWRYLTRHCVGPFDHLAAPPLTLLAWTSWLAGDTATARIVLSRALEINSDYTLAQLLHESINGGIAPERLLESVRKQRLRRTTGRASQGVRAAPGTSPAPAGGGEDGTDPGPGDDRDPDSPAPGTVGVIPSGRDAAPEPAPAAGAGRPAADGTDGTGRTPGHRATVAAPPDAAGPGRPAGLRRRRTPQTAARPPGPPGPPGPSGRYGLRPRPPGADGRATAPPTRAFRPLRG